MMSKVLILDPFAPRTRKLIARKKEIAAIKQAINAPGAQIMLHFGGRGGIGKTRLLQQIETLSKTWKGMPFRWTNIIDLYQGDYHSPDGIRQCIVTRLDPTGDYFQEYRQHHEEFQQRVNEGIPGKQIEELRAQLEIVFRQDYEKLAANYRVLICLDTTEVIQYDTEWAQEIINIPGEAMMIKNWIAERVPNFPNTVVVLAGRPRSELDGIFIARFQERGWQVNKFNLGNFDRKQTESYIAALQEQFKTAVVDTRDSGLLDRIYALSEGLPIRLSLIIDLLKSYTQLDFLDQPDEEARKNIDHSLFDRLLRLPYPVGEMVQYLLKARKGLNRALLQHLVGSQWPNEQIDNAIQTMRQFTFVKIRQVGSGPGDIELFLHDEIYDLYDRMMQNTPVGSDLLEILGYYQAQPSDDLSDPQVQKNNIQRLYYTLQYSFGEGYRLYEQLEVDAIRRRLNDYDLNLREEFLRFRERYAGDKSELKTDRIARHPEVSWPAVERMAAVKWVERLFERNQLSLAYDTAQILRVQSQDFLHWDLIQDPLYRSRLLVIMAWAATHIGKTDEARSCLTEADAILKAFNPATPDEIWWKRFNHGRKFRLEGYLFRTLGEYGVAAEANRFALGLLDEKNFPLERAATLVNLSFLIALLGDVETADFHIETAIRLWKSLKVVYLEALAQNTRGLILAMSDRALSGAKECQDALTILKNIHEPRGIGMAYIGLAFCKRKHADMWKRDLGQYPKEKAPAIYQEAEDALREAEKIFNLDLSGDPHLKVNEPVRLWEVYNEWGSLYCDWAWLERDLGHKKLAEERYARSIEFQQKALAIASAHSWRFNQADSFDDLAQVYGDRTFFFRQLGRLEEAQNDLTQAQNLIQQAENLVREEYLLRDGIGLNNAKGLGQADWFVKGKALLWRGIWAFRDLEENHALDFGKEPQKVTAATRQIILSLIYFHHYGEDSFQLNRTRKYFARFLQAAHVRAEWVSQQVDQIQDEYQEDLGFIKSKVNNLLGVYNH